MTASAHPSDVDFGTGGSNQIRGFWLDELVATMPKFADALCAEVDFAIFFPDKGGSTRPAKRICGSCLEQGPCLAWALESDQRFGIYGGLTPHERRAMTRRRGTPSMGGTTVANAETIRGAAHAAGRAEVLTTPREFPALTPRSTERL